MPSLPDELISNYPGISPILRQLLFNRGLVDVRGVEEFCREDGIFHDPFLFRDMTAAVDLIIFHIKAGNKIIVYGDYDADGVTASTVLLENLLILKANADVYLPDRVSEGYGLNADVIKKIASEGGKLIITVDTGIRNKPEIDLAKSLGIEVIVTDHHVLPDEREARPNCLVIDSADPEDTYPYRLLAGVGVSFKLVSALISRAKISDNEKRMLLDRNLDLVALGTVADLVLLTGENRSLVKRGLKVLNQTGRLGVKELIKVAKVSNTLDSWNISFQLAPRLNAASRIGHANTALALLRSKDQAEAESLAANLNSKNTERQQITENIMAKVDGTINQDDLGSAIVGICEDDEAWNEGVIGLVAGKICEKYYRPTLVITKTEDGYKGSGRSIEEFNLIENIEELRQHLDKYGGHPMACGFSIIGEDNLRLFTEGFKARAALKLKEVSLVPKLKIDVVVDSNQINLDLIKEIVRLAPYGQGNPQPRFASYGMMIEDIANMGSDNQHIKMRFGQVWALGFGQSEKYGHLRPGDKVDIAYYLDINDFNGRSEAQMKIIDIKPHL